MLTKMIKNFEEKKNYHLKFYFAFSITDLLFMTFYLSNAFYLLNAFYLSNAFDILEKFYCFVYTLSTSYNYKLFCIQSVLLIFMS